MAYAQKLAWQNVDATSIPPAVKKHLETAEAAREKFEAEFLALYVKQCGALAANSKLVFSYKRGLAVAVTKASAGAGTNALVFGKVG